MIENFRQTNVRCSHGQCILSYDVMRSASRIVLRQSTSRPTTPEDVIQMVWHMRTLCLADFHTRRSSRDSLINYHTDVGLARWTNLLLMLLFSETLIRMIITDIPSNKLLYQNVCCDTMSTF